MLSTHIAENRAISGDRKIQSRINHFATILSLPELIWLYIELYDYSFGREYDFSIVFDE
jgi:hypothetical protein